MYPSPQTTTTIFSVSLRVFYKYNISNGDYILLCTDGLSSYVGDDMIKDVVLNSNDTDSAVLSLVNSVYDVGAKDNVTAILAKIED